VELELKPAVELELKPAVELELNDRGPVGALHAAVICEAASTLEPPVGLKPEMMCSKIQRLTLKRHLLSGRTQFATRFTTSCAVSAEAVSTTNARIKVELMYGEYLYRIDTNS
jgi:hypothetical protein